MNIIELVFKLLYQFVTFETGKFDELKEKGQTWYRNLSLEIKEGKKSEKDNLLYKFIRLQDEWYMQTLNAVLFLYFFKVIRRWLLTDDFDIDDDDDDDDDGGNGIIKTAAKQGIKQIISKGKL